MSRSAKLILICSTVLVILLTMLMAIAAGLDFTDPVEISAEEPVITGSKAKDVSLKAAGVAKKDATVIRRKLTSKGDKDYYDVMFYTDDGNEVISYEYEIDASTGAVLNGEKKYRKSSKSIYAKDNKVQEDPTKDPSYIGVRKAKRYVLRDAGFSEREVRVTSVELKHENSSSYYKVEFESEDVEYEFHVDARSGKILFREVEYPDDDDDD